MIDLTILSIFRQSSSYLARYFSQIEKAFQLSDGRCHALWLEGDSTDDTCALLAQKKRELEQMGHLVTIVKNDLRKELWPSVKNAKRWNQLAACWNKCLGSLLPSKIAVCVESDLIWDPSIIQKIVPKLDKEHQVIAPMLLLDKSKEVMGEWWFYDTWGFSRGKHKFRLTNPYWKRMKHLRHEKELLEVSTAGGLLGSTYDVYHKSKWDLETCILSYPQGTKVFLDKTLQIYHPATRFINEASQIKIRARKALNSLMDRYALARGYEKITM